MRIKQVKLFLGSSHTVSQNSIEPSNTNQSIFVTAVAGNPSTITNTQNQIAPTTDTAYAQDVASISTSRLRGGRSSSTRVLINTNADTTGKSITETLNSNK